MEVLDEFEDRNEAVSVFQDRCERSQRVPGLYMHFTHRCSVQPLKTLEKTRLFAWLRAC